MPKDRLPAKLSRPRLFDALPRTRLFDALDGERHRAVIWLSGPPGAGKTTLASTWLERQGGRALWYRIDEGDADPATFFHHLSQLTAAHTRKRSLRLPSLTPEFLLDLSTFARRYFRMCYAALPRDSTLVLDRFEATDADTLDALLDVAINELPEGVRLLVTSRAAPSSTLLHWQTQGAMTHVQWPQLRLTLAEARELAPDAPAAAILLHERAGGWTAGFVLLLNHLRRTGEVVGGELSSTAHEALFAYFAHERFAGSSDALQTLLLRTALFPSFTSAEAAALTGNANAPTLLQQLYREHYFIDRDSGTGAGTAPSYRYHDLFREFLLQQGRVLLAPELRRNLLVHTVELLTEAGRREDALSACIEAGAHEAGATLLCELAPELIRAGRNAVVERAAAALGDAERYPWLAYWQGQARLPFDPPGARALFERAFARFDAEDQVHPALLACCGVLESYFLEWGDMHGVDRWADVFQRLAQKDGVFPDCESEIGCRVALNVLSYRRTTYGELLKENQLRLKQLMLETKDMHSRSRATSSLIWNYAENGEWNELRASLVHVDAVLATSLDAPGSVHIVLNLIKSSWHWQAGELQRAIELLEQARSIAHSSGIHVLDTMINAQGVYATLTARDLSLAERFLDAMSRSGTDARALDSAHYDWMRAAIALARGDAHAGLEAANSVVRKAISCGADMPEVQGQLLVILATMDTGRDYDALAHLDALIDRSARLNFGIVLHTALLVKSDVLLQAGKAVLGNETLRAGLALGHSKGSWSLLPWAPWQVLQRCCVAALRAGIEVPYVIEMIRRQRLPAPDIDIEQWPWPIRILTCGAFAVLRDNEPLRFHGKAQHKPLELLKTLIVLGAQDVAQDQLIGMLWPEPPSDGGQKVLEVTLHRLRALLGNNDAIRVSDRRLSLDRDQVWVDVFEIERLLNRPWNDASPAGSDDREHAAARVLSLYSGEFLAGEPEHAALLQVRHRLRSAFAAYVKQLGEGCQRTARWSDGATLYRRAVELDSVAETFYREWMRCLMQLGQYAEAIEVYQRCRTMLSLLLGTRPARETDVLRAQILAVTQGTGPEAGRQ